MESSIIVNCSSKKKQTSFERLNLTKFSIRSTEAVIFGTNMIGQALGKIFVCLKFFFQISSISMFSILA